MARIRAGDDRAFESLYRRYHRRIAGYIQGMVHDHARAEDIAQDVFMSALRRMRDTDRPIAFKPWIYEIAKNACIDQFRRSRRAEEVSYDADDGLGSADYGRLVTKDPSPELRYETKQQLDHLRGAFGGLSETHHEILVMRELEGLSYREIGERLGMTRPAVESTLFRARRRLTEEYEELVTGERCQRVQGIIAAADSSALGARDRRRVARHVSYCQPCLRHARMSGMDAADLVAKPLRAKIAALLPLPAFLKRKWGADDAAMPDVSSLSSWSAQVGAMDPSMISSWGKAAATAATIAIAGVGAGVATNPPDSVRAALGGASLSERLGGDGKASLAASVTRDGGSSAGSARDGGGAQSRESAGGSSTTTSSGATRREATTGAGGGAPVVSAPTSPTAGSGDAASGGVGGSLGDTLSRLGGGGSGSDSGSGGDTGSGTGITGGRTNLPAVPVPAPSGSDAPSVSAPSAGPTAPSDAVDGAVDGVTKGAGDAGSAVTEKSQEAAGILAGE